MHRTSQHFTTPYITLQNSTKPYTCAHKSTTIQYFYKTTYTKLYKLSATFEDFQQLYNKKLRELSNNLHNATQQNVDNILQNLAQFYTTTQHYVQSHKTLHNFAHLYTTLPSFTTLCKTLQNLKTTLQTKLYTTL